MRLLEIGKKNEEKDKLGITKAKNPNIVIKD